jgi:hypothetical protein
LLAFSLPFKKIFGGIMKNSVIRRFAAHLGALLVGLALAAPASADAITPLWYGSWVHSPSATATFFVQFDRAPDLLTMDAFERQADSFQYWTDSEAPDAIGRTFAALRGEIPFGTQTVISAREIPFLNQMELVWPQPDSFTGPRDRGGWGSVEGHAAYRLWGDRLLSFTVPLSLLHDADEHFYYTFETYEYGAWSGVDYDGVSGKFYAVSPVPEPAQVALLLVGVGFLAARGRRLQSGGKENAGAFQAGHV